MHGSYVTILFISISLLQVNSLQWPFSKKNEEDDWKGKWFPMEPGQYDNNPIVNYGKSKENLYDAKHGVKMGVPSNKCDDGKSNLNMDWDNSPINFTCYSDKKMYYPNKNVNPNYSCDHIPVEYNPQHKCMNTMLTYDANIPTFGNHRPLWPKYGEYRFLPKQRWLHSLEHGAIVMLYHPCAYAEEIQLLRQTLTDCVYRHIITPYTLLSPEKPLALVAWGCRLEISKVDPEMTKMFIKKHINKGREHISKDGQFDVELIHHAELVSDQNDSVVCPIPTAAQM